MAGYYPRSYNPHNDWSVDDRGREVNALGQHRIRGWSPRSTPARGFGGLNEHYIRQNFAGSPQAIDAAAQEARKAGVLINSQGQRMADTWANRGFSSRASAMSPYQGPTDDQRRWAGLASRRAGAAAPSEAATGSLGEAMGGSGVSALPRASAMSPYTRAGNIANAKAAGEFDAVRSKFNAESAAAGTGSRMDESGRIISLSKKEDGSGTSPFAREKWGAGAEDIRARRDFARGEAPVRFSGPDMNDPNADEMAPKISRAEKINPYGTATATFGGPKTVATTTDFLGRTVPLNQYLRDQREVQDTKFNAGEDQPLGEANAEQFRKIARGGSVNTSRRRA